MPAWPQCPRRAWRRSGTDGASPCALRTSAFSSGGVVGLGRLDVLFLEALDDPADRVRGAVRQWVGLVGLQDLLGARDRPRLGDRAVVRLPVLPVAAVEHLGLPDL